ncbi:protein Dok-7 isoform X1 [Pygocentrus nattereri]|uniref:Docking protein 7b n=1 Tax=Pygocentrus nattereri TaxID=42514 RepID=A0A3B4DJF9_PYGNA|nr:protein Dok-7 isoform X1 [Pygocentrus nattereri]
MTDTVVVEGQVRLREGRKWKSRWVTLRRPSPVADCLSLLVYKDRSERSKGQRERSQATLGDICGLEALQGYEGMSYTLTVLCLSQSVTLGFDSRENLLAWDSRIRYSLGEVHRFTVNVQPGTKLESGPAILHLCNNLLAVARDIPPSVIGQWRLSDLRRYGAVPNGFVFEGGTRCGYWTGVFFLACTEGEQISFLFDCIARGVSPSRAPFGLRPNLPDPAVNPCSVEERISQEASDLEKRLSLLSVSSRHSSSASHSSYNTSLAGDDRSISSSSSDTSRSDASSRLSAWPDPLRYPTPLEPSPLLSGATAPKPLSASVSTSSDERLYGVVMGGLRPPSRPPPPRGLQEAGRQSSTDSGIATASHSSYSGSFSSYTGSLDTGQGEVDEFGSLYSLVSNTIPIQSVGVQSNTNPNLNTGQRLLPQFQNIYPISRTPSRTSSLAPENRPVCVCPVFSASQEENSEYQVPGHVMPRYDTPRRLIQLHPSTQDTRAPPAPDRRPEPGLSGPSGTAEAAPKLTASMRLSGSGEGMTAPGSSITQHQMICPICGGLKVMPSTPAGISPVSSLPDKPKHELSSSAMSAGAEGTSVEITEAGEKSRYELMSSYGQQKSLWETEGRVSAVPTFPMSSLGIFRQSSFSDPKGNYVCMAFGMEPSRTAEFSARDGQSYGRSLVLPAEAGSIVTDRLQGDSANYVNIPVSPTSKRQLHYMELDLQDVPETGHTVRGTSSTKYAHIDITATETAQRVGAQHAQGREERLQELQQKRRGTLN